MVRSIGKIERVDEVDGRVRVAWFFFFSNYKGLWFRRFGVRCADACF